SRNSATVVTGRYPAPWARSTVTGRWPTCPPTHCPTPDMTTTQPEHAGSAPPVSRAAASAMAVAVAALLIKSPQAVLSLIEPSGMSDHMPTSGSTTTLLIGLAWLLFSAVVLAMRRWVGVLSAMWFSVVSGIGGFGAVTDGYAVWGALQLGTAGVTIVAIIAAVAMGALRGARW